MSKWDHMGDATSSYVDCPNGRVANNYRYMKRDEGSDDDGEDVFMIRQFGSASPSSEYRNGSRVRCDGDERELHTMSATHKHDESEFNDVSLFQSEPTDGSGTVSVSIGYASASVGYSFSAGGQVTKSVSGQSPGWDVDGISGDNEDQTQELHPTSIMIIDDDVNDSRDLTKLRFEADFIEQGFWSDTYHTEWIEWTLHLDNSIQD